MYWRNYDDSNRDKTTGTMECQSVDDGAGTDTGWYWESGTYV